jgi:hypothetical protein
MSSTAASTPAYPACGGRSSRSEASEVRENGVGRRLFSSISRSTGSRSAHSLSIFRHAAGRDPNRPFRWSGQFCFALKHIFSGLSTKPRNTGVLFSEMPAERLARSGRHRVPEKRHRHGSHKDSRSIETKFCTAGEGTDSGRKSKQARM